MGALLFTNDLSETGKLGFTSLRHKNLCISNLFLLLSKIQDKAPQIPTKHQASDPEKNDDISYEWKSQIDIVKYFYKF